MTLYTASATPNVDRLRLKAVERELRDRRLQEALEELLALEGWRGRQQQREGQMWPYGDLDERMREVADRWERLQGAAFREELRRRFAAARRPR